MPDSAPPPDIAHRRRGRVTIEDVAARAQVSVATVSRAMRGLPNVAASTRERVTRAAEALDYQPDPAAARLAAGRTRTVTVVVPRLNGWYFSNVVAGAEAACNVSGYEFQVIGVASTEERDRLVAPTHQLERRTDALVLVDIEISDEQAADLTRRGIALSTIGTERDGHPSVRIDDRLVGRVAADHLLGLGHRRIGLVGGLGDEPMNFAVPVLRRAGFVERLAEAGVDLADELVTYDSFDVDGGREAMAGLLALAEPPTAVFAMSDEMAFGAIMEMDRHGLRPGRDISIIGVDDHEFSRVMKLTTIRQSVSAHGATAARLVIERMERDDESQADDLGAEHVRPTIELVVRATTAPPPAP